MGTCCPGLNNTCTCLDKPLILKATTKISEKKTFTKPKLNYKYKEKYLK